jgi:hypothetical protein
VIVFPKSVLITNTLLQPLCGTLYAVRLKLLAEKSGFSVHAAFQLIARKTESSAVIFQGAKTVEVEGC